MINILRVLVIFLMVCLLACSSPLDQYSDEFNPILQKHVDLIQYDLAQAMDETEQTMLRNAERSNISKSDALGLLDASIAKLERVKDRMSEVQRDYSLLEPPEEAERFHRLSYDMMADRTSALELFIHAANSLSLCVIEGSGTRCGVLQSAEQSVIEASRLFDKADRAFIDVLSEARKLGGVEVFDK